MRLSRIIVSCIVISGVILSACISDKSPVGPGGNQNVTETPISIGMLWKYQVFDSLTMTTDTVWFSITDTTYVSQDAFLAIQQEKFVVGEDYDWTFLSIRKDTLEIFDDTAGSNARELFVFPLKLNSQWSSIGDSTDTSTVTKIGQIQVPAGTFNNGARVDRSWQNDFEGGGKTSRTWVVPDVGIVYRYLHSQFSDGSQITVTTNEVWELIEYDLSTFEIEQYPFEIGTMWKYEEIDSTVEGVADFLMAVDTVVITIIDSGHFATGEYYTRWEIRNSTQTDTQYVVIDDNQMSFRRDSIQNPLWDLYYEFPLAVGRSWGFVFIAPVPEVIDKEPVTTPYKAFSSSFRNRMHGGGFNDYWSQEDWLVPGIGVVRSQRLETDFILSMNRTLTLIDYQAP